MPKIKTNRSAAKRFRVAGSGRLKREKAFGRHLLSAKTRKRKRRLRKGTDVDVSDTPRILRILGKA
jgi:large subunit ribosomal protein L35